MNNELRDLVQFATVASEKTASLAQQSEGLESNLIGLENMIRESLVDVDEIYGSLTDTVEGFQASISSDRASIADRLAAISNAMEEWSVTVDGEANELEKMAAELRMQAQKFESRADDQRNTFEHLSRQAEQAFEAVRASMSSSLANVQAATSGCTGNLATLKSMAADASKQAMQVASDVVTRLAASNKSIEIEMNAVENEIEQTSEQFEEQLTEFHDGTIKLKLEEFAESLSEELTRNLLGLITDNVEDLIAAVKESVGMLNGAHDEDASLLQTLKPVIQEVDGLIEPLAVFADEVQTVANRVSLGFLS